MIGASNGEDNGGQKPITFKRAAITFFAILGPLIVIAVVAGLLLLDQPSLSAPIFAAAVAGVIGSTVWLALARRRLEALPTVPGATRYWGVLLGASVCTVGLGTMLLVGSRVPDWLAIAAIVLAGVGFVLFLYAILRGLPPR